MPFHPKMAISHFSITKIYSAFLNWCLVLFFTHDLAYPLFQLRQSPQLAKCTSNCLPTLSRLWPKHVLKILDFMHAIVGLLYFENCFTFQILVEILKYISTWQIVAYISYLKLYILWILYFEYPENYSSVQYTIYYKLMCTTQNIYCSYAKKNSTAIIHHQFNFLNLTACALLHRTNDANLITKVHTSNNMSKNKTS